MGKARQTQNQAEGEGRHGDVTRGKEMLHIRSRGAKGFQRGLVTCSKPGRSKGQLLLKIKSHLHTEELTSTEVILKRERKRAQSTNSM